MINISTKKITSRLLEVEGLRAFAVLSVIINHFFEAALPSGFLGVDVFFVISGYVITKYLTESHFESWKDFLSQFYARRIKRLLPALLVCVIVTSLVFVKFTTRPPQDVFRTAAFALLGTSNVFLYIRSTDYFSLDAKLNPFTHTWSLGVEEQFYLLFPLALGLAGYVSIGEGKRRSMTWMLPIALALSLILWFALPPTSHAARFYLLPTRIWELAVGALCYIYRSKSVGPQRHDLSVNIDVTAAALVAVMFLPQSEQTWSTVAGVGLTAMLLIAIRPRQLTYRILSSRPLAFIGTISYSLYLWHWSVLVMAKWTLGESVTAKAISLALVLVLALCSFYIVEQPLRHIRLRSNLLIVFTGLLVALALAAFIDRKLPQRTNSENNYLATVFHIKDVPEWPFLECHGRVNTSKFADPLAHCLGADHSSQKPNVLYLIGDSHAAQLYWMAERATNDTGYTVRFVNLEEDVPSSLMLDSPAGSKTLNFVDTNSRKGDILMFSMHRGQFNGDRDKHLPLNETATFNERSMSFVAAITPHIERLERKGVTVFFSRDTPLMNVVSTSPACALQIKLFGESICRVTKEQDLHTRAREDAAYDKLASQFANVKIWDPSPTIYAGRSAVDVTDSSGSYIMQDWNHITQHQSEALAPDFRSFMNRSINHTEH
ncbi:acyltransferase family protein [Herbaspirillum sp. NPDC087042]|uniref:acyltransferase family protein n=1 Tax=Herbaspirillum sp. NPDC087042 TaxID=3364004 RepID=UPI00382E47C5